MAFLATVQWQRFLDGPAIPTMLLITTAATALIICVLAVQWRRVRLAETEGAIKMRMVEKGYSAEEIERVLHTKIEGGRDRKARHARAFVVPAGGC